MRRRLRPATDRPLLLRGLAVAFAATLLLGASCRAETHRLALDDDFATLAATLAPGDEIVLEPGRHRPLLLEGVRGVADRPIVIRGAGMTQPGLVAAEAFGIRIAGCAHVVLEDLLVRGASEVGIDVVASASGEGPARPSEAIVLRRIVILGHEETRSTGVRVRGGRDVRLEQCKFERCVRSSIELDGVEGAAVADASLVGARAGSWCGILVHGASRDQRLSNVIILGGIEHGIALGATVVDRPVAPIERTTEGTAVGTAEGSTQDARPPGPTPSPGPTALLAGLAFAPSSEAPTALRVDQCVIGRSAAALVVGNVGASVMERCTIHLPRGTLVEVLDARPAARVESPLILRRNLFAWPANAITSLARLPEGFDAASIRLEENLWWCEQFEELRSGLGPFPGEVVDPQTTTIDPRLDADGRPANEAAAGFGAG